MKKSQIQCLLILFAFILIPSLAIADDFYVITNTFKTQKEAQDKAALKGGWVLNTNFYSGLKQNLFAVVRGPFDNIEKANKHLNWLMKGNNYPGSYVKNAGKLTLSVNIGNKALDPVAIAMLLGEIRIDVKNYKGAENPCEPQEPYKNISLKFVTISRSWNEKEQKVERSPIDQNLDFGGTFQLIKTGEIERMRICSE